VSPNVYRVKSAEVRDRRSQISQERGRGTPDAAQLAAKVARTLQLANSLGDLYDSLSESKRPQLLRDVFKVVVISSEGIVGFTLRPPFDELASSAKNDPRKLTTGKRDQLAEAILDAA
jgi:hypothetical protein